MTTKRNPPGGGQPPRSLRVRVKRLDQINEEKLALAYWMLAKAIVEDQTTPAADGKDAAKPDDGDASAPDASSGGPS